MHQSVNEMIILFPTNLNSGEIHENLLVLENTSNQMINLTTKFKAKIDLFSNQKMYSPDSESKQILSTSSSASSALSDSNQIDDLTLKNAIVSDLVSYSYEIAHTVKRIVCIMGADN